MEQDIMQIIITGILFLVGLSMMCAGVFALFLLIYGVEVKKPKQGGE